MAAGNQGCKMNCADFPAAANIIPKMAIFSKNVFEFTRQIEHNLSVSICLYVCLLNLTNHNEQENLKYVIVQTG